MIVMQPAVMTDINPAAAEPAAEIAVGKQQRAGAPYTFGFGRTVAQAGNPGGYGAGSSSSGTSTGATSPGGTGSAGPGTTGGGIFTTPSGTSPSYNNLAGSSTSLGTGGS